MIKVNPLMMSYNVVTPEDVTVERIRTYMIIMVFSNLVRYDPVLLTVATISCTFVIFFK